MTSFNILSNFILNLLMVFGSSACGRFGLVGFVFVLSRSDTGNAFSVACCEVLVCFVLFGMLCLLDQWGVCSPIRLCKSPAREPWLNGLRCACTCCCCFMLFLNSSASFHIVNFRFWHCAGLALVFVYCFCVFVFFAFSVHMRLEIAFASVANK